MGAKLMSGAREKKVIARGFTFHDLRACYVTRHNAERGALPDLHANQATPASRERLDENRQGMQFPKREFQSKNGTE